jgi:protein involved in polysaccharide export with SLBB domain
VPLKRIVRLIAILLCLVAGRVAHAQQLPTTDQAKRLLETRPDLIAMLRQEIAKSGLTPDQIRARLRAAGYPDDLLDAYIGPKRGSGNGSAIVGRDSTTGIPTDDILDAMSALGITDSVDTSDLRNLLKQRGEMPRARMRGARDSLSDTLRFADSLAFADTMAADMVDSLGRLVRAPRRRLASRPAVDSGTTIFGLDVFSSGTTQFDPNLAGPVDASYRLGPGDRVVLIITGDAERAFTLDVTREGFVVVPGVGEITAANLTLGQLEDQLYAKLGRVYSGLHRDANATTRFSLNLARLHSNQVYVLGDVAQPGSYRVSSAGTALTALYAAGGPTTNGSMRRVEIKRGGRVVDSLDLYDYLLRADASHDPRLQSGDVVFVPVHGPRVRLYGEITRPGTYELRRGATLADLVRDAGGFTPDAAHRRVQVSRVLPPSQRDSAERARVVIDVASEGQETDDAPAFPLESGDVVRVFRVSDRVAHRVNVQGDVVMPGAVGFTPGMRLSDAVRLAGGAKPDAYADRVLVSRLRAADSTRVQLRGTLDARSDLALQDDDEIRVFSMTEFRTTEYVAITGAVRRPGRYAYREGMTLRDLVLLGGGLDERASLSEAEIARLPRAREGGRLAVAQRVALDSSYLLGKVTSPAPTGSQMAVVQAGRPTAAMRDVTLEPYDNVLILAQPDWEKPRRVVVAGEVVSPGTYALLNKGDRLSDVIRRAGGLTRAADPAGIVFYRAQGHLGRVGVDLAHVLRDTSYRDNLLLQDGDSIFLPQFSGIVEVQGAVNAPRGVAWVPGADITYYVRAAGGATRLADENRSYVTQPDGTVESVVSRHILPDSKPVPKPGSVVYVTQKDQVDHTDPVARLAVIAQIVGGLVALVAIVRRP